MSNLLCAEAFLEALRDISDPGRIADVSSFFADGPENSAFMGVGIGKIFPVAKTFAAMPLPEIERLLDHPHYEVRMEQSP